MVDELQSARFRYRGLEPESGELGEWQDSWVAVDQLPLLVEVSLTGLDGNEWPPLVVALPLAGSTVHGGLTL